MCVVYVYNYVHVYCLVWMLQSLDYCIGPRFDVLKCPWSWKLAPSILKRTLKLEKQPAGCVNGNLVDFGSVGQHPSRVLGGVSYQGMCQLSHNG